MGGDQVQFLPIQWRGSLKFKTASTTEEDEAHSLSNRFALEDITLRKSIPYVRELINNVFVVPVPLDCLGSCFQRPGSKAHRSFRRFTSLPTSLLDIPFYLSKHRESMIEAVATEANRSYRLWTRRFATFPFSFLKSCAA